MQLKPDRRKLVTNYYRNVPYQYRKFSYNNYCRSRFKVMLERKAWFTYIDQFSKLSLPIKRHRCPSNIPNTYNDRYSSAKLQHPLSWKSHYKCPKQWMKNL